MSLARTRRVGRATRLGPYVRVAHFDGRVMVRAILVSEALELRKGGVVRAAEAAVVRASGEMGSVLRERRVACDGTFTVIYCRMGPNGP